MSHDRAALAGQLGLSRHRPGASQGALYWGHADRMVGTGICISSRVLGHITLVPPCQDSWSSSGHELGVPGL